MGRLEARTEDMFSALCVEKGYTSENGITVDRQTCRLVEITTLFIHASKNETGRPGYPDFIITNKTYAAPSIRNAMTDLIRDAFSQYEQRMVDTKDGLAFQKIRLDEVVPGEERILRIEAIVDPAAKSPERIYIEQETMRELYAAMDKLSDREQTYLLYRYGFTDDMEHTMIGTAIHFNLRESRAKKLEEDAMDYLWLELPWWF